MRRAGDGSARRPLVALLHADGVHHRPAAVAQDEEQGGGRRDEDEAGPRAVPPLPAERARRVPAPRRDAAVLQRARLRDARRPVRQVHEPQGGERRRPVRLGGDRGDAGGGGRHGGRRRSRAGASTARGVSGEREGGREGAVIVIAVVANYR